MGGGGKDGGKGDKGANGLTLEITDGITEHANRVALKGVFSAFGDVLACWVPPIDRRGVDAASVRFAIADSAECAKTACDAGQVFFQGLPLKVKWRSGGGPRVGNSDIGGAVGGNSPTRPSLRDDKGAGERGAKRSRSRGRRDGGRDGGRRDGGRDGGRRRDRSRDKRDRSPKQYDPEGAGSEPFNPLMEAPPNMMPPQQMMMPPDMMMMQAMQQPMGAMGGFPGGPPQQQPMIQAMPEPAVRIPTQEEIDREAQRKKEAQERRAKQLKRGPGVAALVQGALKNAQVAVVQAAAAEEERKRNMSPPRKTKEEIEQERKAKVLEEQKERERLERESLEREKEKARQKALEAAQQEAREKEEAATRDARVRAGVDAAKKQQAQREKRVTTVGGKVLMGPENLYGDMPDAGDMPLEDDETEKKRKEELRRAQKNFNLPPEDVGKVIFLDIDGVLRPARAGGFDIQSDGKDAANPDTSDFFPSAMKALRHIMERTGAIVVLTSEWRRNEGLREAIDDVLEANRIRPAYATTPVNVEEVRMSDPVRSFADRRAREVTAWLREHEDSIKGWVVLDDINLAIADEEKKAATKSMSTKLVQTWPLCGLTMGNAKTAVRILNGEMIHKVLVERPKAPGGINMGGTAV